MAISTKENSCNPAKIFLNQTLYVKLSENLFFFRWNFTFIVARYWRNVGV